MRLLFDAHCHATRTIAAPPPAPPEATERRRLVCGVAPEDWETIADWALRWPGTTAAFGVHPWESAGAGLADGSWERDLEARLLQFPDAWVGEIGLDRAKTDRVPAAGQADVFTRQLRLAARLGRGVNLHCVRAHDELLALVDREYLSRCAPGAGRCILHSFAGPPRAVREFAARGAYFSVGPLASRRDSAKIRACAGFLPVDRILLESDAFLHPGVDAEEDLLFTLRWISGVKGMAPEELARIISDNSLRIMHGTD